MLVEVRPPYKSSDYTRITLASSGIFASRLEYNARAMAHAIDSATLESVNSKHYEYGRLSKSTLESSMRPCGNMRFQVKDSIFC